MPLLDWWKKLRSRLARRARGACSCEALLEAARQGDAAAVKALLKRGSPPDKPRTRRLETALALAARRGHAGAARALLAAGADPCAEDHVGNTPLLEAAAGGHHAVIHIMAAVRPNVFYTNYAALALRQAALDGRLSAVRALLLAGTLVEVRARGRASALIAAAASDSECVAQLLAAGADPLEVDLQGRTALHHAATADDKQSVLLLLAAGADVGAKDHDGRTALDDAVSDEVRDLLRPPPPPPPPAVEDTDGDGPFFQLSPRQ